MTESILKSNIDNTYILQLKHNTTPALYQDIAMVDEKTAKELIKTLSSNFDVTTNLEKWKNLALEAGDILIAIDEQGKISEVDDPDELSTLEKINKQATRIFYAKIYGIEDFESKLVEHENQEQTVEDIDNIIHLIQNNKNITFYVDNDEWYAAKENNLENIIARGDGVYGYTLLQAMAKILGVKIENV